MNRRKATFVMKKTVSEANGNKIEVWVYGNFDAVGFVNGTVALIHS
jgi:hypothetical protein